MKKEVTLHQHISHNFIHQDLHDFPLSFYNNANKGFDFTIKKIKGTLELDVKNYNNHAEIITIMLNVCTLFVINVMYFAFVVCILF